MYLDYSVKDVPGRSLGLGANVAGHLAYGGLDAGDVGASHPPGKLGNGPTTNEQQLQQQREQLAAPSAKASPGHRSKHDAYELGEQERCPTAQAGTRVQRQATDALDSSAIAPDGAHEPGREDTAPQRPNQANPDPLIRGVTDQPLLEQVLKCCPV